MFRPYCFVWRNVSRLHESSAYKIRWCRTRSMWLGSILVRIRYWTLYLSPPPFTVRTHQHLALWKSIGPEVWEKESSCIAGSLHYCHKCCLPNNRNQIFHGNQSTSFGQTQKQYHEPSLSPNMLYTGQLLPRISWYKHCNCCSIVHFNLRTESHVYTYIIEELL